MEQLLQDSLAICHDCRKPDLFLTMTANPTWPEIANNLLPGKYVLFLCVNFVLSALLQLIGQSATDQPDLVARVFYQKQQALLQKIQKGYYGSVAGLV